MGGYAASPINRAIIMTDINRRGFRIFTTLTHTVILKKVLFLVVYKREIRFIQKND